MLKLNYENIKNVARNSMQFYIIHFQRTYICNVYVFVLHAALNLPIQLLTKILPRFTKKSKIVDMFSF